jgi:hypothetical protein
MGDAVDCNDVCVNLGVVVVDGERTKKMNRLCRNGYNIDEAHTHNEKLQSKL